MHLTQVAFLALLLVALVAAFSRGGRPERIGGGLFLAAALATPIVQTAWFERVEIGVAAVDVVLLAALLLLAGRSSRRWPVIAAGFQAVGALVHLARREAGVVHGDAYAHLAVLWSYPVLLALLWGSLVEARRAQGAWNLHQTSGVGLEGVGARPVRRSTDDQQLLAELLRLHGLGPDPEALARQLLDRFGSFGAAIAAPPARLRAWGMGEDVVSAFAFARSAARSSLRRMLETRPLIDRNDVAVDYLHSELAHLPTEQFRVLYLNAKYRLILDEVHGEGSITEAAVYTREIVKRALEVGAVHLVLAHNHPGGDPTPSREDIAITREIHSAMKLIGGAVRDHFVIAPSGHVSLRAAGLL